MGDSSEATRSVFERMLENLKGQDLLDWRLAGRHGPGLRDELRAELPLARWLSLTFDLGLAVPLDRRQFVLTLGAARTVLHQPSAVAGRASAGLSVRF